MSTGPYVSRGGAKLRHALDEFNVDVTGLTCADLGCSTGGFTDCLLQAGAAKVYAIDTAYGELAWKLRKDPRVVVMERTNALHTEPPAPVDLVVVDLGWTPQKSLIPVALKWLKPIHKPVPPTCGSEQVGAPITGPPTPAILTLIKPHYEAKHSPFAAKAEGSRGILPDDLAEQIADYVLAQLPAMGVSIDGFTRSPLRGGSKADGNLEWLALLSPIDTQPPR
ncbi:MAG: TlyA family RNA methyltransferase [Phycisphaerales bacterium]|nr:TlyA family RNA methyltransferase [Phycisphaerales bacterium]